MDNKEHVSDDSELDAHRPAKRLRRTPPPSVPHPSTPSSSYNTMSNGNSNGFGRSPSNLPPLSLSILGVEPLDEFIREVADFIHHMIGKRPEGAGQVEVEAKIGVLRDKTSGQRLQLPVLVETSACAPSLPSVSWVSRPSQLDSILSSTMSLCIVLMPNSIDCRFESNMSPVRSFCQSFTAYTQPGFRLCRCNINISIRF